MLKTRGMEEYPRDHPHYILDRKVFYGNSIPTSHGKYHERLVGAERNLKSVHLDQIVYASRCGMLAEHATLRSLA